MREYWRCRLFDCRNLEPRERRRRLLRAFAGAPAANISKVKMNAVMILFPKIVFILMKIPQLRVVGSARAFRCCVPGQ